MNSRLHDRPAAPRSGRSPARPRGVSVATTLLLFLLGALCTVTAATGEIQISFSPAAPIWRDAVVVTVSSSGPHCAPELSEPTVTFTGVWLIDLDLTADTCHIDPPLGGPFSVTRALPPLSPRLATVRVHDVQGGGPPATAPLTIHPGADLAITPHEPASSAEPLRFALEGVGACPEAEVQSASNGVVRVQYSGNCPILPPGEHVFALELETAPLAAGEWEIAVFDHTVGLEPVPAVSALVTVWDATRCVPTATSHCLERGRFRVESRFRDFQSRSGDGRALPTTLDDTGLFWFFLPDNVELTVKVLDGCGVNDRFWVFIASGSTVEYEIVVTDTLSGQERVYGNDLGQVPELVADTAAFATCP